MTFMMYVKELHFRLGNDVTHPYFSLFDDVFLLDFMAVFCVELAPVFVAVF